MTAQLCVKGPVQNTLPFITVYTNLNSFLMQTPCTVCLTVCLTRMPYGDAYGARMAQLHDQIPPYLRGPEPELTIFRNAMRNVPFADAILATEPLSTEDLEQKLALRIQNMTQHIPVEPKEESSATTLVNKLAEVLNVGSPYGRPPNSQPYNRPYSKAKKDGNKTSSHPKNYSHQKQSPRQNPIKRNTGKPLECAYCGSRFHLVCKCPDCPPDERETYRRKAMDKAINTVEMPAVIKSQLRQAMAEEL